MLGQITISLFSWGYQQNNGIDKIVSEFRHNIHRDSNYQKRTSILGCLFLLLMHINELNIG